MEQVEMFVIYHAFGVKVGCTREFPKRCYAQGFKDGEFEIIDQVSKSLGPKFAGDVEEAWATWFGYSRRGHYRNTWGDGTGHRQINAGKRCGELGKSGWQTGAAGKSGGKVAMAKQLALGIHSSQKGTGAFHNGAAGRASAASPLNVVRQGKSGFQTGAAGKIGGRAAAASPKSINKRPLKCPHCGAEGVGPTMYRHHFNRCKRGTK